MMYELYVQCKSSKNGVQLQASPRFLSIAVRQRTSGRGKDILIQRRRGKAKAGNRHVGIGSTIKISNSKYVL